MISLFITGAREFTHWRVYFAFNNNINTNTKELIDAHFVQIRGNCYFLAILPNIFYIISVFVSVCCLYEPMGFMTSTVCK